MLGEIEEHFRNICESCSPVFENNEEPVSPKFKRGEDEDDLLGDLGNTSTDEGVSAAKPTTAKKLKKKPLPHYLTSTNASKAMQRPKSPLVKTGARTQNMSSKGGHTGGGP